MNRKHSALAVVAILANAAWFAVGAQHAVESLGSYLGETRVAYVVSQLVFLAVPVVNGLALWFGLWRPMPLLLVGILNVASMVNSPYLFSLWFNSLGYYYLSNLELALLGLGLFVPPVAMLVLWFDGRSEREQWTKTRLHKPWS